MSIKEWKMTQKNRTVGVRRIAKATIALQEIYLYLPEREK